MRISYEELLAKFQKILESRGFSGEHARDAATVFAQNSLDGVYSHGVNRFPRVVEYLDKGEIDCHSIAECVERMGAIERWDGHRGFGPLNARLAMGRACKLAKECGVGVVALGNNNHWMRVGNNPFIMSIPRSDGRHAVVDCAVSQFSYGKIEETRLKGRQLPVPGGYDSEGNLTTDPAKIEESWRVLPMGYWKGSGISIALDLIATVLTNANSVSKIGTFGDEVGLSQVMIAIDPCKFNSVELTDRIVDEILADIKASQPAETGGEVFYPGEIELNTRKENLANGIPVIDEVWQTILSLER